MKVGLTQYGSIYCSANASRRRARVGFSGIGMDSSSNIVRRSATAVGEERSGSFRPLFFSIVGIKGNWANGVEKFNSSGAESDGKYVDLSASTASFRPRISFSVLSIREGRVAPTS